MDHPDPNRKKEPCKDKCTACKHCAERAKLKKTSPEKESAPEPPK
ncbi:hypothetical protein SAMN02745181_3280 [Rubritalea squalenifaciens DSM 18772]|uniref:Uncharacterized protein n=1 Tax=Rubritalea squalenifaciens DSM 18772 TaxID=1123071 RepID=A0A1M6PSG9_9BACT|nr:hypothetical protein SAMN02745181_3280 [Rubritalea squalenifaciens DSM 18772]